MILLQTENTKRNSSGAEDHQLAVDRRNRFSEILSDVSVKVFGADGILDNKDTLDTAPSNTVIYERKKSVVGLGSIIRNRMIKSAMKQLASSIPGNLTGNRVRTQDIPYKSFFPEPRPMEVIENLPEKYQNIGFLKKQPSYEEMQVEEAIPKATSFGDPNEMNCNDTFCYLNGRTLKKELITENPKDMFTFLPPEEEFLKEFKNPCWKGNDLLDREAMFCLPYFYIIGFTKAGTTDLFGILKKHVLISSRARKETHFFDRRRRGRVPPMHRPPNRLPRSFRFYANRGSFRDYLMPTYQEFEGTDVLFHGITMDATPSYVWDNEFWEKFHPGYKEPPVTTADTLAKLNPKTKFIFSLRDPINRMRSAYQYFCKTLQTYKCDRPITPEKYHNLVVEAVDKFNNCLKENTLRGCTYSTETHQLATHLYASIYHVYILDYMKVFPKNQIFILQMEERIRDPITTYNNLCDFLEIPRFPARKLKSILKERGESVRNQIPDEMKIPYVLPETTELLEKFFRPYLRDLVDLLGDEKWYWNRH